MDEDGKARALPRSTVSEHVRMLMDQGCGLGSRYSINIPEFSQIGRKIAGCEVNNTVKDAEGASRRLVGVGAMLALLTASTSQALTLSMRLGERVSAMADSKPFKLRIVAGS